MNAVLIVALGGWMLAAVLGLLFMAVCRKGDPADDVDGVIDTMAALHREDKTRHRLAHQAETDRLTSDLARVRAELLAEQAATRSIVAADVVTRTEYDRVCAELATLRRAWEHGIDFVADGDRPVIEHRHDEVA